MLLMKIPPKFELSQEGINLHIMWMIIGHIAFVFNKENVNLMIPPQGGYKYLAANLKTHRATSVFFCAQTP